MTHGAGFSINQKLTAIMMSVAGVALLLAAAAFVVHDRLKLKEDLVSHVSTIATMSGTACSAALVYDYPEDVKETLQALKEKSNILHGIVFRTDRTVFASYHRAGADTSYIPHLSITDGHLFHDDHFDLYQHIVLDNEIIGTIYIQTDLQELHARLDGQIKVVGVIVLLIALLAYLMASRLRRVVSDPLLNLRRVAGDVTAKKDYSLRATATSRDEMGFLVDSFNEMLAQIQTRDSDLRHAQLVLENSAGQLKQELTDRKRAERSLKESEEYYRSLIENASDVISILDAAGNVTYESPSHKRILGYDSGFLIGKRSFDYVHPDDQEQTKRKFLELLSNPGGTVQVEFRFRHRDGHWCHLEGVGNNLLDLPSVRGIVVNYRDNTERKAAEEHQQELQDKLDRAERMESLGILAGGVAHDLNNMLGPVVGYAELIQRQTPPRSKIRTQVERIGKSAQDAANVIQDLLTLARRGRYEMETTNLNDVIISYLDSPGHRKLQKGKPEITVNVQMDHSIPNIMGSAPHLSKVVMNLIVNAFDAMPEVGTLTINTSAEQLDQLQSGHADIKPDNYVMASIADTGSGIEPADLLKIFEPYYSKKRLDSSGSGLGLAVVYGIIKDHKGYHDVFSTVGEGTEFVLYIPATETVAGETGISELTIEGSETVLVVDDVRDQREMASELIESLGYEVHTAVHGHDALEFLKHKTVDLVVLDMIMEDGFDGLDTFREIIKLHPGQKTIIVSGFSATDRVEEMQSLGAGQYIKKPYRIEQIGQAIREELAGQPGSKNGERTPV